MTSSQARKDRSAVVRRTQRCSTCNKVMGAREAKWLPDVGPVCKRCRTTITDWAAEGESPA